MFHFTGVQTVRTGDPMLRYAHEELLQFIFVLKNKTPGAILTPPAPARGGLKVIIQICSYRLAKPLKPIFFLKVEKSGAN